MIKAVFYWRLLRRMKLSHSLMWTSLVYPQLSKKRL